MLKGGNDGTDPRQEKIIILLRFNLKSLKQRQKWQKFHSGLGNTQFIRKTAQKKFFAIFQCIFFRKIAPDRIFSLF